ncbi:WHG domain-containing protein [Streptomyces sp. NBC_00400]|uniref:TetR-like C-terminal domain-containing protein n=1 Tax=Streptomyces sp. NBC_00400 TaxID=2975737 RepID=UPI002E23F854
MSHEPRAAAGETFADRLGGFVRAYVDFAVANAELLDLMYTVKHDPAASEALITAAQRLGAMAAELVAEGQRSGEVREGPVDDIGMPVFTTLHGFASFAVAACSPPTRSSPASMRSLRTWCGAARRVEGPAAFTPGGLHTRRPSHPV